MKILEITSVPITYKGGTEKVVLELSKEMSKKHEVAILQTNLYEEKKPYKKVTKIGKVKVITAKNDRFMGGFGYSKEFKQILKKIYKKFDIVHIHGHGRFTSNYALKFLKNKKPIIYTAHGFFHDKENSKIKQIYNKYFQFLKNNATYYTALTKIEAQSYLSLRINKEKIKILPNWIDLKENKKSKKTKIYFKNKNLTFLSTGRIHKSKGIQYTLEAIKELNANLLIVGRDAGYKKELESKIKNLKLEKKVKILGEITNNELKTAYSLADAFILFSAWEGFGIVILEAMAFGLPVIASNKGALPLLIKNKENGLIAKYPSIKSLKEQMELLIKDKKLLKKMKKNSTEFVKKYDVKKIIGGYEKLYGEAIKNFTRK